MEYLINILKHEDIKEKILDFAKEKDWEKAYIIGAIGSVCDVHLVNPQNDKIPPELMGQTIKDSCEVLNFSGEVMKKKYMSDIMKTLYKDDENPYFVHIHMSCSTKGQRVYGGGLRKGRAFIGLKVFVKEIKN